MDLSSIKSQIIRALEHPEAEEGLYFRNFYNLHEEDEREPVSASEDQILDALNELIREGRVAISEHGEDIIFRLSPQ